MLAILSGSPDCSILAMDVETGSVIARVEDAHEWVLNYYAFSIFVLVGFDEHCS